MGGERGPVKVALLGGGTFAETAYLPVLGPDHHDRELIGVWSRSEEKAKAISEKAGGVRYWHGAEGLDELLGRPELEAVFIVVAAQATLEIVRKALRAGKWVLSEKPAGPTLDEVQGLLAWMESESIPTCRWAVQENYRGESGLVRAAELVRSGRYGAAVKLDLKAELPMAPGGRYYNSSWRRDLPGSFLLEGGVHFVAGLRLLCEAAGLGEVGRVSALLKRARGDVPEPDTLVGWGETSGGSPVGFSITQGGAVPRFLVSFVGTEGTVEAQRGVWGAWQEAADAGYVVHAQRKDGGREDHAPDARLPCALPFDGVGVQVSRFLRGVASLRGGGLGADAQEARAVCVEEAAQDLALMETLLRSGRERGAILDVPLVIPEDEEEILAGRHNA